MRRHPLDPVSAALGILTVTAGLLVMLGESADIDTSGGWWIAVAAVLVGIAIIPWRLRPSAPRPDADGAADETERDDSAPS
jgi:hypothetical protein